MLGFLYVLKRTQDKEQNFKKTYSEATFTYPELQQYENKPVIEAFDDETSPVAKKAPVIEFLTGSLTSETERNWENDSFYATIRSDRNNLKFGDDCKSSSLVRG